MASNTAVKKTAKTAIKDNALACIAAGVVFLFVCLVGVLAMEVVAMVLSSVAALVFALIFVVAAAFPLYLGLLRFFRRMLWGENDAIVSVFYYFSSKKSFKSAFLLSWNLVARTVAAYLILNIPALVIQALASAELYQVLDVAIPVWSSYLWPLSAFFEIAAVILLVLFMLKFYMAPFLFVSTENTVTECIDLAQRISNRTAADYFWFVLSLAGWIVLSVLAVPLVFTLPYFIACYIVYCRFAVAQYNKVVDSMKNTPPSFEADSGI